MGGTADLDRVIAGARVFDGRRFLDGASVGIKDGRIAHVGPGIPPCRELTRRPGFILAPAFIDTHNHGDFHCLDPQNDGHSALRQGIGTVVVGNCGFSAAPQTDADPVLLPPAGARNFAVGDLARRLDLGLALDVADLLGHNTLRLSVLGSPRASSPAETSRMAGLLAEHLQQGGAGLSVGLNFSAAAGCDERELLSLCRVLGRHGRPLTCHLRSQGEGLVEAVEEVARLGERAGCAVLLSHLRPVPGRFDSLLPRVLERIDCTPWLFADLYPYTAGCARLEFFFHQGFGRMPEPGRWIAEEAVDRRIRDWHPGGYADVLVVEHRRRDWVGRSAAEIAAAEQDAPGIVLQRVLLEDPGCLCVYRRNSSEEAVEQVLLHPKCFVGSDGYLFASSYGGACHPRSFAAITRFLVRYVRSGKLTEEEGLAKLTRRPAAFFRLADRGEIREGLKADLCLFRFEALDERADFRVPSAASGGLEELVLAGTPVWSEAGGGTGVRLGRRARPTAIPGPERPPEQVAPGFSAGRIP